MSNTGNVYVADRYNQRIRKVTVSTGIISTIAGSGASSYSGDGGPATSAALCYPYGVTVDSSGTQCNYKYSPNYVFLTTYPRLGNVYIGDSNNQRVRKVTISTGIISTVAGTGTVGYSGDGGDATSATLNAAGVAVDTAGNVYIADYTFNVVRKVTVGGTYGPR